MSKKNDIKKRVLAGTMAGIVITGLTAGSIVYDQNQDFRRELNRTVFSIMGTSFNSAVNKENYANTSLSKDKYYVYTNGKRQILSKKESIEGYEKQGIYSSRSSSDVIAYVSINTNYGYDTSYTEYSYDDLEEGSKVYNFFKDSDIAIINETAPESVSADIKYVSIDQVDEDNIAKTMTKNSKK